MQYLDILILKKLFIVSWDIFILKSYLSLMWNSNLIEWHVFIFAKFGNPGLAGKNRDPVRCVLLLLWNQQAVEDRESGSTGEPAVDLREVTVENTGLVLKSSWSLYLAACMWTTDIKITSISDFSDPDISTYLRL